MFQCGTSVGTLRRALKSHSVGRCLHLSLSSAPCFLTAHFFHFLLVFYSDRHHVSSSIPVPIKPQLSVSAASEMSYPFHHDSSPERGVRKRVSSEDEAQLKYKLAPPQSSNAATGEQQPPGDLTPPLPAPKQPSSSLDASMASLNTTPTTEANKAGEQEEDVEKCGDANVKEEEGRVDKETEADEGEVNEQPPSSPGASNTCLKQDVGDESVSAVQHMNGSLLPGQTPVNPVPEPHCSVEQAEEIMGTEATGLGVGVGLADEARLEDYHCIPVDHAVAVECDEQVLGELAVFEEFSRRIYALNENPSSFRMPRKNSDK